jgi:hypothetical protein
MKNAASNDQDHTIRRKHRQRMVRASRAMLLPVLFLLILMLSVTLMKTIGSTACHIEKMVRKLEEGFEWVYSLRKIYSKQGEYLCEDDCESTR